MLHAWIAVIGFVAALPPDPHSTTIVLERATPESIVSRTLTCSHGRPEHLVTTEQIRANDTDDADKLWCWISQVDVLQRAKVDGGAQTCHVATHAWRSPLELVPSPDGKSWRTKKPYGTKCGQMNAEYAPVPNGKSGEWRLVETIVGPAFSGEGCADKMTAEFRSAREPRNMKCDAVDVCSTCVFPKKPTP